MIWCPADAGLGDAGPVELAGGGASVDSGDAGGVTLLGAADVGALEEVALGARANPLPQPLTASAAVTAQMTALDPINGHLLRT